MTEDVSIDDCFLHDKDRLRHDEALSLLNRNLVNITDRETVALSEASNRILAENIDAPHEVPLHTNAAVDGYAFRHADLAGKSMPVAARIAAGDLNPYPLPSGAAVRIFTGAVMPPGADSVAMQEDCEVDGDRVAIPAALKAGANCRKAGEDLEHGSRVLEAGTRLRASDLAAAASIGMAQLPVHQELKVIVFSSGNEMRRTGDASTPLKPGEVWDANFPLLSTLLQKLPVNITDGGILADDRSSVQTALENAGKDYDIILTTGGASRGAEDHMLAALDEIGKRHLWQLAVKPGRPMMFGQIARVGQSNDCFYFGLPGNPVAAMVCFLLYVRPAILKLSGATWNEPTRFPVPAAFELANKKPDRREFLRGILSYDSGGKLTVDKFERDGSGLISSLRLADGLVEITEEARSVTKGELVNFIPFTSFD